MLGSGAEHSQFLSNMVTVCFLGPCHVSMAVYLFFLGRTWTMSMPGMPCLPASGAEDWKSHSASTKNISCIAFLRMPRVCHDYKVCFSTASVFLFFSKTKTHQIGITTSLMCESSLGVFPRHLKEMLAKGHSWPWQDSRDTEPPPSACFVGCSKTHPFGCVRNAGRKSS